MVFRQNFLDDSLYDLSDSQCIPDKCDEIYTGKKCKCYPNVNVDNLKYLEKNERNKIINSTQFCAFQDSKGFLTGCDSGCCEKKGCPGECIGVPSRPPEAFPLKKFRPTNGPPPANHKNRHFLKIFKVVFLWIVFLLFFATLACLL